MNNFIRYYSNIQNPITKFFNKIQNLELTGDKSKNIKWLEAMKKVPLYVKWIRISSNNAEELENLTDPNLYNTLIDNLELALWNSFKFSSKTIENLKAIYPNSITLSTNHRNKGEPIKQALLMNFTKLLSKLDHTSLEMKLNKYSYNCKLEFSDVILKVVKSMKKCSYIRAKSVRIDCRAEEFCWIK